MPQTPLWIYFLNPLVALIVAVSAYFLGKAQGREQTSFARKLDAINELRGRIYDINSDIAMLPDMHASENRPAFSRELKNKLHEITRYRGRDGIWLTSEITSKVDPILDGFTRVAVHLLKDEGKADFPSNLSFAKAIDVAKEF
jgi:hypothetical protein